LLFFFSLVVVNLHLIISLIICLIDDWRTVDFKIFIAFGYDFMLISDANLSHFDDDEKKEKNSHNNGGGVHSFYQKIFLNSLIVMFLRGLIIVPSFGNKIPSKSLATHNPLSSLKPRH
jgi:hypothetical protein